FIFCLVFSYFFLGLLSAQTEIDLEGPISYSSTTLKVSGKAYPWSKVHSLTENAFSIENNLWLKMEKGPPEIKPELLEELQKKKQALQKGGNKLERTNLAQWCKKNQLYSQQWELLVDVVCEDGWYRAANNQLLDLTEHRFPKTVGIPPFEGLWEALVDTTKHHQEKCWALWAIDFVKVDEQGRNFSGTGLKLTDHYSWGETIYAIADGTVTHADDHFPDFPVNKVGGYDEANFVMILHEGGESSSYGHLQQKSVLVKMGDLVKKGQAIGKAGNSGRSGIPHLHFAFAVAAYTNTGNSQYISVPYLFENFHASLRKETHKKKILMKRVRPQEGWILECPRPEMKKD
ncbi:MAG: M23 family metallopeptidase, partial [Planctomycetota bacterium]